MTLNIISNFAANTTLRNLQINGDEAAKSVGKLSSGSRIVTAADDAAALAIGTRLNSEVKALETAAVNAGQAVSLLQIADGGLNRVQELLTRMKVLAVQSGSENISNRERNLLDTEFQNLKAEVARLTADTKFNGIEIVGAETIVVGANVTAANTNANLGLAAFDDPAVLSDAVGNDKGVVDISIRGVDNRAVSLGGDGEFTLTLYQGDIVIDDNTGASTQFPQAVQNFGLPVVASAAVSPSPDTVGVESITFQTNQTNFAVVGFNPDGVLEYQPLRFDTSRDDLTQQNYAYGEDNTEPQAASGPPPTFPVELTLSIAPGPATIGAAVQNTGGIPATAGQDLIFTAIFEFGDLDGDGQNDVLIKKAKIDGGLIENANDPTNANAVTISTGVSLVFGEHESDLSLGGGISQQTKKNAAFVIALDPAKASALNLANDVGGVFEGLFNGAAGGFAQGAFAAQAENSGVTGFDFKVGSGIIKDEDVISIGIGGATLESLGIVQAEIRTKTSADSAGETVSAALDYLVNLRSDIGANINRLEVAGDNIAISIENQEAARSRLMDLDVAREVARFTSNQLLLDTGVSVLTQAQSLPAEALRLYGAI